MQFIVEFDQSVFIPSVCSPNNDGINDIIQLFAAESNNTFVESMMIYNRWGGAVFSVQDVILPIRDISWDGLQGGREAAEGVYVYDVLLYARDGHIERRFGNLTLVR